MKPVADFVDGAWVDNLLGEIVIGGLTFSGETPRDRREWFEWHWASRDDQGRTEAAGDRAKTLGDRYQFSCKRCARTPELSKATLVKLLDGCRDMGAPGDEDVTVDLSKLPF